MPNKTLLQKVSDVLHTSSQTFMLIALVSLFAIPMVIATNIEPMVRVEPSSVNYNYAYVPQTPTKVAEVTDNNVLGATAQKKDIKEYVTVDLASLNKLKSPVIEYSDSKIKVTFSSDKLFKSTKILELNNKSNEMLFYTIKSEVSVTATNKNKGSREIIIDTIPYTVGDNYELAVPVEPGQTREVSVASEKTPVSKFEVVIIM